jgi:hypothetical protein
MNSTSPTAEQEIAANPTTDGFGPQTGERGKPALLTALKAGSDPKRGKIVMINGSPTDPNTGGLKR